MISRGAKWSNEEESKLLNLYKGGYNFKEISERVGRTEGSCRAKLKYLYIMQNEDPSHDIKPSRTKRRDQKDCKKRDDWDYSTIDSGIPDMMVY